MILDKLTSAVYNDIVSGLRGYSNSISLSLEQLTDDIADERLAIIKEYFLKGLVPKQELLLSITCIEIGCKSMDKCYCGIDDPYKEFTAHFEIPQLVTDFGSEAIEFIGSSDKTVSFQVYTNLTSWRYSKYRKRYQKRPSVFVDTTPNENGMYDCWLFNAPIIKKVTVVGIFKNLAQLEQYACCSSDLLDHFQTISFIDNQIKQRVTEKKIKYYRQFSPPILPNDQAPK